MGTVYEIVFYLFCRTFFLYTFDLRKENKYQTLKLVLLKVVKCNHRFSRIFREVSIPGKKVDVTINGSGGIIVCFMLRCFQKLSSLSQVESESHCISTTLEYRAWRDNLLRLLIDVGVTECPPALTPTSLVSPWGCD